MTPCNYADYPANWKTEIRPAIQSRANDKCEWCGVANHARGFRGADGKFIAEDAERFIPDDWLATAKAIRIVCTVMHLDHDTKNNDPSNLKFACQRCHNIYDAQHRRVNASYTRDAKRGQTLMEIAP